MFIVLEFQTDAEGNTTAVAPVSFASINEAKNKYYTVLAFAAISEVAYHTAVLMHYSGNVLASECIEHIRN